MKVFISFASEDRRVAEKIHFAVVSSGHTTFYDSESLPPAGDFVARIRAELAQSDLLVFLVSPESVRLGTYALTELRYAREKWPHAKDRVLPVMVRTVPFDDIPAYLSTVTVLEPQGNVEAEVALIVSSLAGGIRRSRLLRLLKMSAVIALVVALSASAVWLWWRPVASSLDRRSAATSIGGTFAYAGFRSVEDLRLVGNARPSGEFLELTPLAYYQVGAVWYRHRVAVADGFQTAFVFGTRRNPNTLGSDGLAFVIQADRPDAIGSWGGNLGYDGIRKSLAVEFDMIQNLDLHDPNGNHVSIQTRYGQPNSADHGHPTSIGYTQHLTVSLADGNLHTAYIDYEGTKLSVYVDDRVTPVVSAEINLREVVGSASGLAWVGITAASGGYAQANLVRSWKLDANAPFERNDVAASQR